MSKMSKFEPAIITASDTKKKEPEYKEIKYKKKKIIVGTMRKKKKPKKPKGATKKQRKAKTKEKPKSVRHETTPV